MNIYRQFLNPPNWFSAASLFCGFYAMILSGSAEGDPAHYSKAGLMIFFSGVFDMLDGRVARLTKTSSAFGVQLDSLIDILSFGVAPTVLAYFWALESLGTLGALVAFFFMLCGAFRLARFNVMAAEGKTSNASCGLTITTGGTTLAAVIMFFANAGVSSLDNPAPLIGLMLAISWLMISSVPYRTHKSMRLSPKVLAAIALGAGVCLVVGAVYDISAVLMLMSVSYVVSGPLEAVFRYPSRRRARAAARAEGREPPSEEW